VRTPRHPHFRQCLDRRSQDGDLSSVTTQVVAEEPAFAGFATRRMRIEKKTEAKEPGTRGSAMALVQYQQITGDGLGNAPRPPLR